ncbi:unnamed protein product [Psylliodes chrysocephalus]|uniref:Uncharacterized protein n=1 Tax=Psylliodes chrysocephalus TaxID=3402493 RepID=A0A9P0GAF8_9CUCU|nr:unnamed protein product [Psylliodes chrysocephala]
MRRYQFVKHIILNRFDQNTQQTVVDDVDGNLGVAENISIKFADRVRKARKHSSVNIIFNASMISTFPQDKCLSNSKNKHLLISVLKSVHLQPTENVSVVRIAQIVNSENDTTEVYVEELLESSTDSIANNSEIWSSKGKPSEEILATKKLLKLRGSDKYKKYLMKKNPQSKLCKYIAMEMNEDGFEVTAVKKDVLDDIGSGIKKFGNTVAETVKDGHETVKEKLGVQT